MSAENVREFFRKKNLEDLVIYCETIADTVESAAKSLECEPQQVAKTISFVVQSEPIVVVASGDARIDNPKFKGVFGTRPKMIPRSDVKRLTGYPPGGICPFALKENVRVFLDESLKRFGVVFTGGGDEYNMVKVTIPQLEEFSAYEAWIDVCKNWNDEAC